MPSGKNKRRHSGPPYLIPNKMEFASPRRDTDKTFKEWKARGYHVIKGQKATGRNDAGEATFTKKQVAVNHFYDCGDDGGDYQDDYDQFEAEYGHSRDWF